jgi:hypothetical protein
VLRSFLTAFRLSKGYRFAPWKSPYLRWRIETWSGRDADALTPAEFLKFTWDNRKDLIRYLRWAAAKGAV